MFDAIKNHIGRVKALLKLAIIFLISLIVLLHFKQIEIKNPDSIEEQQIYILGLSLNNCCTIITMFAAIAGGCWAIHQYDKNRKLQQQEKASEIAIKFSTELINKLSVISHILTRNQKFKEILKKIDPDKLSTFSFYEIVDLSKDKYIVEKFNVILHSRNTQKEYEYLLRTQYDDEERKNFDSKFVRLVEVTLNQLEAECMNISSQAAGSQYIYPSLHQVFLYDVHVLSIMIAQNNTNNFDKYFINIIDVYNKWNKQKQEDKNLFDKTSQKIKKLELKKSNGIKKLETKRNNEVKKLKAQRDDEIKKLLNKKPRTV